MKKILFTLLFIVLSLNANKVFALEISNDMSNYRIANSGGESEYILNHQIAQQRLEQIHAKNMIDKTNSSITPFGGGSYHSLSFYGNYPNYQQERNYWCGPATIKQAVQWINNSSASQLTYANSMGTNSTSGSYVYKMRNEMNLRQSQHSYVYTDVSQMNNEWDLWASVTADISYDSVPVIVHALTDVLYMYNGRRLGHYITITGYYDDYLGPEWNSFEYVDSFSADYGRGNVMGVHEVDFLDLYNSLKNSGRFLIW